MPLFQNLSGGCNPGAAVSSKGFTGGWSSSQLTHVGCWWDSVFCGFGGESPPSLPSVHRTAHSMASCRVSKCLGEGGGREQPKTEPMIIWNLILKVTSITFATHRQESLDTAHAQGERRPQQCDPPPRQESGIHEGHCGPPIP